MRELKAAIAFVTVTTVGAMLALGSAWPSTGAFPGWWALGAFVFIAFVLDNLHTDLRFDARGSTSFVVHLSACLLFGGFWAGVTAGAATLVGQLTLGNKALKSFFNVSQRILAITVAASIYASL